MQPLSCVSASFYAGKTGRSLSGKYDAIAADNRGMRACRCRRIDEYRLYKGRVPEPIDVA
jgi:hypothetical protein